MNLFLKALLCGGISGLIIGLAEGIMGIIDTPVFTLLFAIGLLSPLGIILTLAIAVFASMLPQKARPHNWWAALKEKNSTLTIKIFVLGLVFLFSIPLHYRLSLFFITQFNHPQLAALCLLCSQIIITIVLLLFCTRLIMVLQFFCSRYNLDKTEIARPLWTLLFCYIAWITALSTGYARANPSSGLFGFVGLIRVDGLDIKPFVSIFLLFLLGVILFIFIQKIKIKTYLLAIIISVMLFSFPVLSHIVSQKNPACADGLNDVGALSYVTGATLRRFGDKDGDGHSWWFGGRDCDDTNPQIYPGAVEIPDDGIDQNCSGYDLKLADLKAKVKLPPPPSKMEKPELPEDISVVLITVDSLRDDAVGFMGQERLVTPRLDKFFKKGIIYKNAYSISSYTSQSLPAMMTGKYPSELHRNNRHKLRVSQEEVFAAELICLEPIKCAGLMSHFLFKPFYGWHQGFTHWEYVEGLPKDVKSSAQKYTSPEVNRIALNWLDDPANTAGQFFMWVHYMDPHGDYLEHAGFKKFGNSRRDKYDHEILYTDYHIGLLLDRFEELDLLKKTVFILTSDHGESFFEQGRWFHGYELFEENIRVPLAITGPGLKPKEINRPTSLIHIFATLLDLFNIDSEKHKTAHSISLLGEWTPENKLDIPYVFADQCPNEKYESRRAFIYKGWKLHLLDGGRYRFFNLNKEGEKGESLHLKEPKAFEMVKNAYDLFLTTTLKPIPPVEYDHGPLQNMPNP